MTEHVAIQRKEYTSGTSDKPEIGVFCRCRKNEGTPFGKVHKGDTIWVKWSSGQVIAKCNVEKVFDIRYRNLEEVRRLTEDFHLFGLMSFWREQPTSGFATVVFTGNEKWLEEPFTPQGRSYGAGWVQLDTDKRAREWLFPRPGD